MTPEPRFISLRIKKLKAHLDELQEEYERLSALAYDADAANPVEREVAKKAIIEVWKKLQPLIDFDSLG